MFYLEEYNVVLGCPISNREMFLPYYLENIYQLEFNRKKLSLYFVVNNSQDNSEKILKKFKLDHEHEYKNITIDYYYGNRNTPQDQRTNDIRLRHTYKHLSALRNMLLKHTVANNYSHLYSIDSDIMIKPDSLNKLLLANVDIVSGIIYNGYLHKPEAPFQFPNILKYNANGNLEHVSNWYVKNAANLTESKLIEVDANGAISLISNKACSELSYGFDIQGEDMFFCKMAQRKGYKLYAELNCYNDHCMNEELLQQYIESRNIV